MIESGSWSHGTAVAGHSDVDWMALYPKDARTTYPSSALAALKEAMTGSHHAIYRLRQSSPTVQIEFYTPPDFEIVPAYFLKKVGDEHLFTIPGPGGEWVESAPIPHLRYVTEQNIRLNSRLKPLVRIVKAWKYHVGVPVRRSTLRCGRLNIPLGRVRSCTTSTFALYGLARGHQDESDERSDRFGLAHPCYLL